MTTDWRPGEVVAGDFVVERDLGRGGHGRVTLVRSRRSGERYAAKRLVSEDLVEQGRLLAEAQRWVVLPAHPHITACRFVRTIGDEVAVFSEYAPGGSLADRIARRDLTETAIRTAAAQAAWGLDAVHAMGMLHLDVKPANILFDADGTAKIADFGLAARHEVPPAQTAQLEAVIDYIAGDLGEAAKHVLWTQLAGEQDTIAAVPAGATSAYASPEQAEGRAAGREADLWSWAVTVLEMFVGERTWPSGTVAPFVLDAVAGGRQACRVPLPPDVADLLRACFALDPADRPRSLEEASRVVGVPGLTAPGRPSVTASSEPRSRRFGEGAGWEDPRGYLRFAYEAAGRDPDEAIARWPRRGGGFAAHALADLHAFQDAATVLRETLTEGRNAEDRTAEDRNAEGRQAEGRQGEGRNVEVLARVLVSQARVRQALADDGGAIGDLRSAAALLDTATPAHRAMRAWTLHWLAIALREHGDLAEARTVGKEAIAGADDVGDPEDAARLRGSALLALANTMIADRSGDPFEPLGAALDELRAARNVGGQARVLAATAALRERRGDGAAAAALWDEADALLTAAGEDEDDAPTAESVPVVRALMAMNRATLASGMPERLVHATRAVDLLTPLVERQGRHDLSTELAAACVSAAYAYEHLGRPQESLAAYRRGRELYERAVVRDGRTDLADELSECLEFESTLTFNLYGAEQALEPVRAAVERWRRLAELEGMDRWGRQLIRARVRLAITLEDAARPGALEVLDEAARDAAALGPARTPWFATQIATIHRERAVVHRRSGDLQAAFDECEAALAVLDEGGDEATTTRMLTLETLSAVLAEAGYADEALNALAAATGIAETLAATGGRDAAALADSHRRLASLLMETGRPEQAAQEGATAAALYAEVLPNRPDLRFDAFRCAYLTGSALHMLGRVEEAADAYRQARASGGGLGDDDVSMSRLRSHPGIARRLYESTGAEPPDTATLFRVLDGQIAELDALLALPPERLGERLAGIEASMAQAGELGRSGHTHEASRLLEPLLGSALWLSRRHRGEAAAVLAGELGLSLGVTALHAQRDAPALRGFRTAVASYGELAGRSGGERHRERWFDAHIGLATCLTVVGDAAGTEEVARELERQVRRWTPHRVGHWRRRLRTSLDGLRS
ncbi:hypothetical protein DMB42_18970 [Nonomuraea sp. WAC 01424]|uniref:protein kinase domain-containing protein n=1 Tax=Nonomuraea sp. WAC 01424 TaxID=2203200 RepID=UPI000F7B6131|nr:protein kinase [Nonomuraea sp. WAC 01424]RSN09384.1 hypothetical protein DMB42_18970 [Nonomuraea sp. WAC 01424]